MKNLAQIGSISALLLSINLTTFDLTANAEYVPPQATVDELLDLSNDFIKGLGSANGNKRTPSFSILNKGTLINTGCISPSLARYIKTNEIINPKSKLPLSPINILGKFNILKLKSIKIAIGKNNNIR